VDINNAIFMKRDFSQALIFKFANDILKI